MKLDMNAWKQKQMARNEWGLESILVEEFENTDEIICVSNSTKEDLLDIYKIPEKKVNVVYHGSDHLDQIEVDRKKIESQLIDQIYKPFLLYVGKRHRYKNYELLVNAFAKSKMLKDNFHIIFFGGEKPADNFWAVPFSTHILLVTSIQEWFPRISTSASSKVYPVITLVGH